MFLHDLSILPKNSCHDLIPNPRIIFKFNARVWKKDGRFLYWKQEAGPHRLRSWHIAFKSQCGRGGRIHKSISGHVTTTLISSSSRRPVHQVRAWRQIEAPVAFSAQPTEAVTDRPEREINCTRETKEAFNIKIWLLTSKLNIELRKKLVRCSVWSMALYGSDTWTLRKLERKYLESFEISCWRRMEKIKWPEKVTNEHIGGKRTLLNISYVEKPIGLVIFWEEIASFMMPLKDRWRKWKE